MGFLGYANGFFGYANGFLVFLYLSAFEGIFIIFSYVFLGTINNDIYNKFIHYISMEISKVIIS